MLLNVDVIGKDSDNDIAHHTRCVTSQVTIRAADTLGVYVQERQMKPHGIKTQDMKASITTSKH